MTTISRKMKAVPVKTLRERFSEFLLVALLTLGVGLSLNYLHEKDVEREKTAAFKQGFATAKVMLEQPLSPEQQAEVAIKWWAGSPDMKNVRQRLCSNVSDNALKGSK